MFSYLDTDGTVAAEDALLKRVDCVFAINDALAERKRAVNPETHLAPHGVDHALFAARARSRHARPRRPRGAPEARHRLLRHAAGLGRPRADRRGRAAPSGVEHRAHRPDPDRPASLERLPNVHLLGAHAYEELPGYCKGFDVGLIPYLAPTSCRSQPDQAARVPLGRPAGGLDGGARSPALPSVVCRRLGRRRLRAGSRSRARRRLAGAPPRALASDAGRDLAGTGGRDRRDGRPGRSPHAGSQRQGIYGGNVMTRAPFRAGMVGAGNICEFHVAAVQALPDVELVGICDLDAARAEETAEKWGTKAFASLDALVDAGANVIHVLTPPARTRRSRSRRSSAAATCSSRSRSPRASRTPAGSARWPRPGTWSRASTTRCSTIRRSCARSSGALRRARRRRRRRHPARLGVPAVRGRPAAAASSRRGLSVPRHRRPLPVPHPGAARPNRGRRGRVASLGGDPNLAFDEWRALVRCRARPRPVPADLEHEADAEPDDHPRHERRAARRPVRDVPRQARARRCPRRPSGWSTRSPTRSSRWSTCRSASGSSCARRSRRTRACATWSPTSTAGSRPGNRRRSRSTTPRRSSTGSRRSRAPPTPSTRAPRALHASPTAVPGHRRVGLASARRSSSGCSPRASACAPSCAASPTSRSTASSTLRQPRRSGGRRSRGAGAESVIHAGAAMKGGWPEHHGGTVVGTQNVIDACRRHGVRQLVHICSMSVVDWAGSLRDGPVSEDTPLEPRAEERGAYTRAKLEAEQLVTAAAAAGLPCVILRPGQIFGGGIPLVNGAVARRAGGRWLVLGDGELQLPLVYIDDASTRSWPAWSVTSSTARSSSSSTRSELTQDDVLALAAAAGSPCACRARSCSRSASSASTRSARSACRRRSPSTACVRAWRAWSSSPPGGGAARVAAAGGRARGHPA